MSKFVKIKQFQDGLSFDLEHDGQNWRGFINSKNAIEEIIANGFIIINSIEIFDKFGKVIYLGNKTHRVCQIHKI